MDPTPVPIDLGSGLFHRLVGQAAGSPCSVTFETPDGPETVRAIIEPRACSKVALRFADSMKTFPIQVLVTVPGCRLTFESTVRNYVSDLEFALHHPLWAMAPRETGDEVAQVEFPLRYALTGTTDWYSGASVEIMGQVVGFVGQAPLPNDARLELRIRLPHHPLPMLVRARVVRSAMLGDGALIEALMLVQSFQTEHALARALGKTAPNCPLERGDPRVV